jgi:hypothetical protein
MAAQVLEQADATLAARRLWYLGATFPASGARSGLRRWPAGVPDEMREAPNEG